MSKEQQRTDQIVLERAALRYESEGKTVWQFKVSEILLIAEWTDDSGPYLDDYFYFFVAGTPPRFFEAPVSANASLIEALTELMGSSFHSVLASTTSFRSNVMWPPALAGRDLFVYSSQRRSAGVWNSVKDRLLPLVHSELTPEIREYLERQAS
jgi:hypothetical protein